VTTHLPVYLGYRVPDVFPCLTVAIDNGTWSGVWYWRDANRATNVSDKFDKMPIPGDSVTDEWNTP